MDYKICCYVLGVALVSSVWGCGQPSMPAPFAVSRPATLGGSVMYEDGTPAVGARISISDPVTGDNADVVAADAAGRYRSHVPAGAYAIAVASQKGFSWDASVAVPDMQHHVKLSTTCHTLTGGIDRSAPGVTVNFERQSSNKGDTFVATVQSDKTFVICLPEGQYRAYLSGDLSSSSTKIDLPGTTRLQLQAIPTRELIRPPVGLAPMRADLDALIADIAARKPKLIGLGEATHGTAEFYSSRQRLTFELIRRGHVRLLLFELDAIACVALDDYVNGGDVDLEKAVAALGFWTTDTHEFLHFLRSLRELNATVRQKIHLWGVDIQNTTLPIGVLNRNADELGITGEQLALLGRLTKRGAGVKEFSELERSNINALLQRLSTPRSSARRDLLNAVAARSLSLQLEYWTGDTSSWSRKRRDIGMASLSKFIVESSGLDAACLWAHDAHISKEPNEAMLGYHLSLADLRYYSIGFYLMAGSTRAWDPGAKIGVISHSVPIAPAYTVEGVVSATTGMPTVAWLPLKHLPSSLRTWLDVPRFVREVYAVYNGPKATLVLRDIPVAFDAIVVIRSGHDSSPTATGVRSATQE